MSAREAYDWVRMRMQAGGNLADLRSIQRLREIEAEAEALLTDGRPIRRRQKKEKKIKVKREPNQWQRNLTAWNAGNSGWCIPRKDTADYEKVKNWHLRPSMAHTPSPGRDYRLDPSYYSRSTQGEPTPRQLQYEDIMSLEREYREAPNVKSTDKRTPYRRVAEMQTPRSIDFDRYLEENG